MRLCALAVLMIRPQPFCLHRRHREAGGVEGRGQVDGDDRVPFLGREVLDRRDVLDAGIVDEDVGPAELVGAALHHRLDRRRVGHVGAVVDRAELAALALDLGGGRRSR